MLPDFVRFCTYCRVVRVRNRDYRVAHGAPGWEHLGCQTFDTEADAEAAARDLCLPIRRESPVVRGDRGSRGIRGRESA